MLFNITREELEIQGINYKEALQIIFQNRLFTRGLDLPPKSRQAALKFAQYYLDSGFVCLLAEHRWYLTVWLEAQKTNVINSQINKPITTDKSDTNILSQSTKFEADEKAKINSLIVSDSEQMDSQELAEYDEQKEFAWEKSIPESETDIQPIVQPQPDSESDNDSSNDLPENDQKHSRKRRVRRYRGISY